MTISADAPTPEPHPDSGGQGLSGPGTDQLALVARVVELREVLEDVEKLIGRAAFYGEGNERRTHREVLALRARVRNALSVGRCVAEEMDATQVRAALGQAGITLSLSEDASSLIPEPREALSPKLRLAFRLNHASLLRGELFREAARYISGHLREREGSSADAQALRTAHEAMEEAFPRVEEAWHAEDIERFKDALRQWLLAGLRAHRQTPFAAAQGSEGTGNDTEEPERWIPSSAPDDTTHR